MQESEHSTAWPIAVVALIIGGSVLALLLLVGIGVAMVAWSAQQFGEAVAANAAAAAPPAAASPAIALRHRAGIELAGTELLPDFRKDFTVEFWCRLDAGADSHYLVGNEAWPAMAPKNLPVPTLCGWVLRTTRAKTGGRTWDVTVATRQDGAPQWQSFVTPAHADPVAWCHVALVRADGRLALYIGGTRLLHHDVGATDFIAATGPLYVGVRQFAHTDRQVSADVCAFRVSARARYRAAFVPPLEFRNDDADLVLLDFTQAGEAGRVTDRSGHQRHGALLGGAQWITVPDRPGAG